MVMKCGLFSRPAMSKLPTPPVCRRKNRLVVCGARPVSLGEDNWLHPQEGLHSSGRVLPGGPNQPACHCEHSGQSAPCLWPSYLLPRHRPEGLCCVSPAL